MGCTEGFKRKVLRASRCTACSMLGVNVEWAGLKRGPSFEQQRLPRTTWYCLVHDVPGTTRFASYLVRAVVTHDEQPPSVRALFELKCCARSRH